MRRPCRWMPHAKDLAEQKYRRSLGFWWQLWSYHSSPVLSLKFMLHKKTFNSSLVWETYFWSLLLVPVFSSWYSHKETKSLRAVQQMSVTLISLPPPSSDHAHTVLPLINNWKYSCEFVEVWWNLTKSQTSDAWTMPSPQMSFVCPTLFFLNPELVAIIWKSGDFT